MVALYLVDYMRGLRVSALFYDINSIYIIIGETIVIVDNSLFNYIRIGSAKNKY